MAINPSETPVPTRTLASTATVEGVTLFTGVSTRAHIAPAAPGLGWTFRRTDLPGSPEIPVRADRVREEARRTVLSLDPADPRSPSVQTVEHLLSALAGLGVTDARIDVDGPEIPIADGSALPFVQALDSAGMISSDRKIQPVVIAAPLRVESDPTTWIEATPPRPGDAPGLTIEYHLDYRGMPGMTPALEPSLCERRAFFARAFFTHDPAAQEDYRRHIAPARTFSLAAEAEAARRMGLFAHLTPRDMLVLGPDGPIDNTLRFEDEPIRHKLLDLLGDIAAIGLPVIGRIVAHRTGHAMNNRLARRLAEAQA